MSKENPKFRLSGDRRHMLKIVNRIAIGSIIVIWGGLMAMKQAGILARSASTLPFLCIAFGTLLILGGTYRLHARSEESRNNFEQ